VRAVDTKNGLSRGDTLRLHHGQDERTVRVSSVEFPWLEGVEDAPKGPVPVRLDLREFDKVETYTFGWGVALTTIVVIGIIAPITGIAVFAALPKGG